MRIANIKRRKVSIEAAILDPKEQNEHAAHATVSGLTVVNRGVLPEEYM